MNNKDENLRLEELRLKIENSYSKWYDENKDKLKAPALDLSFMNTHPEMAAAPDFSDNKTKKAPPSEKKFRIRHLRGSVRFIAAVLLTAILISTIAFAGFASPQSRTEYLLEESNIQKTLANYELGMARSGMFSSQEETTASMSEEEIQNDINNYSLLIDSAYSEENPCRNLYKEDYAYYLQEPFKNRSDWRLIDCGVSDIRIADLWIRGDTASAKYVACSWSKSVRFDGTNYTPDAGEGRTYYEVELVKEDNIWKVKKAEQLIPFEASCYDEEEVKEAVKELRRFMNYSKAFADRKNIDSETEKTLREKIEQNKNLLNQNFDNFQDARDAAMSADIVNETYYALY